MTRLGEPGGRDWSAGKAKGRGPIWKEKAEASLSFKAKGSNWSTGWDNLQNEWLQIYCRQSRLPRPLGCSLDPNKFHTQALWIRWADFLSRFLGFFPRCHVCMLDPFLTLRSFVGPRFTRVFPKLRAEAQVWRRSGAGALIDGSHDGRWCVPIGKEVGPFQDGLAFP